MQAPCPHCNQTLSHDYLDSVMDEMASNQNFSYTIQHDCSYLNCQKPINFSKELNMYYLIAINGNKEIIGGK